MDIQKDKIISIAEEMFNKSKGKTGGRFVCHILMNGEDRINKDTSNFL